MNSSMMMDHHSHNDISTLARELLTNEDAGIRRQIAEQLSGVDSYVAIAALANALRDENKGVRDAAERSLIAIGNEHVARSVVDYLLDTNISLRNTAAEILIKLGTCSINAVLPYLYDADHDVRKFAVDILGVIGDSSPVEHLIPFLNDPDDNVVFSTVEALGNIGSQRAVRDLQRIYEHRDDCKAVVAEALGKIGGDEACDFLLQKYCEQILQSDVDQLLLYTMLEALSKCGNKKALTILREQIGMLKGHLNYLIIHAVVQIGLRCNACEIGWLPYKQYLLEALSAEEPFIRISAIQALHTLKDDDITTALFLELGKNEEVDLLLLDILPQRSKFLEIAVKTICSAEFMLSKVFLLVLRKYLKNLTYANLHQEFLIHEVTYLHTLSQLLGKQWYSADEETRPILIELLFLLDGDHAIEVLSDVTEYPDPWVKMQVIEYLAPVSGRQAVDFIARFVSDDDEMVRQLAITILESKGYSSEFTQTPSAEVQ
ncbi:MAG: HEAT repeat domain-containing protein [Bacteroidetes bacterium]|nr:HEAT repeat domain-containing protein [Bacteroidota bacterium]